MFGWGSAKEKYEFTNMTVFFWNPFMYIAAYLALFLSTFAERLTSEIVLGLGFFGVLLPAFAISNCGTRQSKVGLVGFLAWAQGASNRGIRREYRIVFSEFDVMAAQFVERYGSHLTESERAVLRVNSFLFLIPYFAKGGEFLKSPSFALKELTRPLWGLIGKEPDYMVRFFKKFRQGAYLGFFGAALPVICGSLYRIFRYGEIREIWLYLLPGVVFALFLLGLAIYELQNGRLFRKLWGNYQVRAKRTLEFCRRNCKDERERQRYSEKVFLDACYTLERKLSIVNPSTEELWTFLEWERINQARGVVEKKAAEAELDQKIDDAMAQIGMNIKK